MKVARIGRKETSKKSEGIIADEIPQWKMIFRSFLPTARWRICGSIPSCGLNLAFWFTPDMFFVGTSGTRETANIGAVISIPMSFFKPRSKTWWTLGTTGTGALIQVIPNVPTSKNIPGKRETRINTDYSQCHREKHWINRHIPNKAIRRRENRPADHRNKSISL